ncbi:amidohydrolase family protein [Streptomyces sp. NPDC093984]|uniref:amidohydrolase family protein n=1 Tax=Streptomyces sp. NPDC093984 TaxID=3366052 RepID=UPI0038119C3B
MDQWGVATSLLSISSPGVHFGDDTAARALSRHVNEAGAEIKRQSPLGSGTSPRCRSPTSTAPWRSWPTPWTNSAATASHSRPTRTACISETRAWNRRRTPVFVHPTSPPNHRQVALGRPRPMLEFLFDSARTVSDLVFSGHLVKYPDIPWIFTHGGGALPLLSERMELFRSVFAGDSDPPGDNPPIGPIPEQVGRLWFDLAGTPFPHQVPALTAAFGTERVLYGSDYCFTPALGASAQVTSIDAAPQPDSDTWRALTTCNALRLFPRLNGSSEHD